MKINISMTIKLKVQLLKTLLFKILCILKYKEKYKNLEKFSVHYQKCFWILFKQT